MTYNDPAPVLEINPQGLSHNILLFSYDVNATIANSSDTVGNMKKMALILFVLLTSLKGGYGACLDHFLQSRTTLSGYGPSVNTYSCLRWDHNLISEIPSGLFHGTITTYLNFDNNRFTTEGIPHDAFNRMTSLQTIHLQESFLTVIKVGCLKIRTLDSDLNTPVLLEFGAPI